MSSHTRQTTESVLRLLFLTCAVGAASWAAPAHAENVDFNDADRPERGASNWSNVYLPSIYPGETFRSQGDRRMRRARPHKAKPVLTGIENTGIAVEAVSSANLVLLDPGNTLDQRFAGITGLDIAGTIYNVEFNHNALGTTLYPSAASFTFATFARSQTAGAAIDADVRSVGCRGGVLYG